MAQIIYSKDVQCKFTTELTTFTCQHFVTFPKRLASSHLNYCVLERVVVSISQEYNAMTMLCTKPRPLDPESSSISQDLISNSPYCLPYNSHDKVQRIWYWINLLIFSLFSPLVCLILYWYCKEKFYCSHSREVKG